MSIWNSTTLCVEEIEELKKNTAFDIQEIESLYERFKYLDRTGVGFLTFVEFQMIPEFYSNPFSRLIINHLERMKLFEKISFGIYLEFLGIFSGKSPKSKRISFLFSLFDLDGTGKITRKDLCRIYVMMTKDDTIEPVVDEEAVNEVLRLFDKKSKGYLDLNDFTDFYNSDSSLEKNMVLDFSKYISREEPKGFWAYVWPESIEKQKKI